ncbi:hypothetical protein PAMA_012864 [Pampus argenteus]
MLMLRVSSAVGKLRKRPGESEAAASTYHFLLCEHSKGHQALREGLLTAVNPGQSGWSHSRMMGKRDGCFFSINPEKGTKVVKTSSRLPVNPRVLTLIQDLADHEWCNA